MNAHILVLCLSVAVFLITHIGLSSTPLRGAVVARIGENAFLGLYSLIALIALIWMCVAYSQVPYSVYLWLPGPGLRHLPLLIMPFAFIFLAAGVLTQNPTAVRMEDALGREDAVQGILRITRHPVQWAIILWSATHILVNGDLASVIFFGGFLVLSGAGTLLIDRKMAETAGQEWRNFAEATSNIPFAAILRGRNRLHFAEIGWSKVALGLVLYGVFLIIHPYLFGVTPY